jgi:hypothetical protein
MSRLRRYKPYDDDKVNVKKAASEKQVKNKPFECNRTLAPKQVNNLVLFNVEDKHVQDEQVEDEYVLDGRVVKWEVRWKGQEGKLAQKDDFQIQEWHFIVPLKKAFEEFGVLLSRASEGIHQKKEDMIALFMKWSGREQTYKREDGKWRTRVLPVEEMTLLGQRLKDEKVKNRLCSRKLLLPQLRWDSHNGWTTP